MNDDTSIPPPREARQRWKEGHREEYLAKKRAWAKRWRKTNPELAKERARQQHAANPQPARDRAKAWKEANRARKRTWERQRSRARWALDPDYRLKYLFRSQLRYALKKQGAMKRCSVMTLIGCTIRELRLHLERQFAPGMDWENHGSAWEIDHIVPCAAFDLTDPEQQRRCFFYQNLQPLWADVNRKKGAR